MQVLGAFKSSTISKKRIYIYIYIYSQSMYPFFLFKIGNFDQHAKYFGLEKEEFIISIPGNNKKMQSPTLCFGRVSCSILSKQSITKSIRSQPMSSCLNGTSASNNNGKECEIMIQEPLSTCISTYQSNKQQNS